MIESKELGSVEGYLLSLNQVREPLWNRIVECELSSDLVQNAQGMLGKRVSIFGWVHLDHNDWPVKIIAWEIEQFPDQADLPSGEEVQALLRNLPSEEV